MTTIKLSGGSFGDHKMLVRCNLAQASAGVQVNYCNERDSEFEGTQFQCADARHTTVGLIRLGRILAAEALEVPIDEFQCESEEVHIYSVQTDGFSSDDIEAADLDGAIEYAFSGEGLDGGYCRIECDGEEVLVIGKPF